MKQNCGREIFMNKFFFIFFVCFELLFCRFLICMNDSSKSDVELGDTKKDLIINVSVLESFDSSLKDRVLKYNNLGHSRIIFNFSEGGVVRKESRFGSCCNSLCWTGQYIIGLVALSISCFSLILDINNLINKD